MLRSHCGYSSNIVPTAFGLGLTLLLFSTESGIADCLDDYVALNGTGRPLAEVINDPVFKKCRGNPNPRDRARKLDRAAAIAPIPPQLPASQSSPPLTPSPPAYVTNIYPLLRSSFNDVWLFDKRKGVSDIADAEGAQLSFADDRIAQNRTWTAHAMGAVVFQYLHDRYPKDNSFNFIGLSVAPYVQIDRISNSNPRAAVNNIDQLTFGGSTEIGFDLGPGSNYFRLRGAGIDDRIAGTSSGSAVLEWIPIIDGLLNSPREFAGIPVSFMFGPELKARYDNIVVNDASGAKEYLARGGAQAILKYSVIKDALPEPLQKIGFLSSLHGQTTYSWLTSSVSGKAYGLFNSSVTYNIDSEGYIGLTGSYTKGRSEDTGRKQDIWRLSLTGKL